MLADRRFRRLDRDRLGRRALRRAWPDVLGELEGLIAAHARFSEAGDVPGLHRATQSLVDRLNHVFDLPPKRYEIWRDMVLRFDPRRMFGG